VAYFGASVDTPEDNKRFAEELGLDFALLSDPGKQVATAYGVVGADRPLARRWTFYIGIDGKILYVETKVSPATAGSDVAAKLTELGIAKVK
jgi:thioredoxin-dependent peroxiredoxin